MTSRRPVVLGLTGSIGMGKSAAAAHLRRLGVPVHDADAEIHRLLREDPAVIDAVEAVFPGVTRNGGVDRRELGRRVFGDAAALNRLESLLHPRVRQVASRFLRRAASERIPVVALDIPLLFETGSQGRCDVVVVVSAPDFVQAGRVLHRPGMTGERLAAILARQTPDALKQRGADFVVPTGLDRRTALQALGRVVTLARRGQVGRPWRRGHRRA